MSFMTLAERHALKGNYRGYSYKDEMVGNAIQQLVANGLKFDAARSDNAFAFYYTTIKHSFARTLNLEKRQRDIRDEILIAAGETPSHTKQLEHSLNTGNHAVVSDPLTSKQAGSPDKPRRGRPPGRRGSPKLAA